MDTVKIDNGILVVKLNGENELKICKSESFNTAKNVLTDELYNLLEDAQCYCSITYIDSLNGYFDTELDKSELEQLHEQIQSEEFRREFNLMINELNDLSESLSNLPQSFEDMLIDELDKL